MIKQTTLSLVCLACFIACSDPASEKIESSELFPVQFNIGFQKDVLPFPSSTRSMPSVDVPEPTASPQDDTTTELSDICSTIEYLVYDESNTTKPLKHRTYRTNDEDFGIVYDTLPKGNYLLRFLAHSTTTTQFADNIFSFDKVSDTFYDAKDLVIDKKAKDRAEDITLERIVCRVEFRASDVVPNNVKRFDISVKNQANKLNAFTGKGIASAEAQVFSDEFATEDVGKTEYTHSFYTFVPEEGTTLSINIASFGAGGDTIRAWTISDVAPISNKIIRYTGELYTPAQSGGTFSISIIDGSKWGSVDEKELTD